MKSVYKVAFMCSRNKDNSNVQNFHQRSKTLLVDTNKTNFASYLTRQFDNFTKEGQKGETTRLYLSVNSRSMEVLQNRLFHFLIDRDSDEVKWDGFESLLCKLASQPGGADTKYWLLDVDVTDGVDYGNLLDYIKEANIKVFDTVRTINGFHIVIKSCDTRELLEKFPFVTLLRDGYLLLDYKVNN